MKKRKESIFILNIILISMLFAVLSISEANSLTEGITSRFEITQERDGNSGEYDYNPHPKFNSEELEHQYTKVDVSNIFVTATQSKEASSISEIHSHSQSFDFDEEENYAGYNPAIETSLDYEIKPNEDYSSFSELNHQDGNYKRLDEPELYEVCETTTSVGESWQDCSYTSGYGAGYSFRLELTDIPDTDYYGDVEIDLNGDLSVDYSVSFLPHAAITLTGGSGTFDLRLADIDPGNTQDITWQIIVKDYTKTFSTTIDKDNSYLFNNLDLSMDLYQVDDITISVGSTIVYSKGYTHDATISDSIEADIIEDEITIDIEYFSQTGYVDLDLLIFKNVYSVFDKIEMDFSYRIGSGMSETTTLDLDFFLTVQDPTSFSDLSESLSTSIDVTDFDPSFTYSTEKFKILDDSVDFLIENSKNTFTFDYSFEITTYRNYVPSSINLKCNGKEVNDLSTMSGFCVFDSYQSAFEFTSDVSSISFSYEATSYFEHNISLDEISSSYLYKAISIDSDVSLDITYIEHSINDIQYWSVSGYTYDSNPDNYASFTDFSVSDGSNLYLEIITSENIHKSLNPSTNYIYSSDITTDTPLVSYIYSYQAAEDFNYWYFQNPDFTDYINPLNPLDSFNEGESITLIEDPLMSGDIVNFRVYRKPGFTISYSEISSNDQQTIYKISYSANFDIDNVDLIVELDKYYAEWTLGTQTEEKILTIEDLDFTNKTQYLEITGSIPDPSEVYFSNFELGSPGTIFDPEGEVVEIYGYLDITESNFAYHIPDIKENWNIDQIYDYLGAEISVNAQDNFFNDSNLLNPYLSFQCNPIKAYTLNQSDTQLTITIESDLNISINVMYYIENLENNIRNLNESNHYVGNDGEVTWYYQMFQLKTGENIFTIEFEEQTPSVWGKYIAVFLLIAIVGYAISKSDLTSVKEKIRKWRNK